MVLLSNIISFICTQLNGSEYRNVILIIQGCACGVMVIVVGNGYGDTSSNPGRE